MPATTPNELLPYPLGADPIRIAQDVQALAVAVDTALQERVNRNGDTMTGVLHVPPGITVGTAPDQIFLNGDGSSDFRNSAFFRDGVTIAPKLTIDAGTSEAIRINGPPNGPDYTGRVNFYSLFETPTPGVPELKGWFGSFGPNMELHAQKGLLRFFSWNSETMRLDDPFIHMGGQPGNAPWPEGTAEGFTLRKNQYCYMTNSIMNTPCYTANKIGDGNTNGTDFMQFRRGGNLIGSITSPVGGQTSFNTTSDYRAKSVQGPITGALDRLRQLRPVRAIYSADETHTEVDTFVAHEVSEVVPAAVSGEKDGAEMQMLDVSKLIPLLVAAVQELAGGTA